ncbi:integrase catalytic domain-containing protein, partial [Trichonephila clavata]
ENSIAYTADIEKASLQIELHEQDRDVALIFWTKNLNEFDPKNLQVYRLTRVLFGLTSSPFMLVASTRHHLKKYKDKFPDTAKIVESSLGLSVKNLKKCDAWWNEPHWLHQPEENWSKSEVEDVEEKNLELRRKSEKTIQNQCILEPNDHVLDPKKYSSLNKVLRVIAWILRFLTNSRRNIIKDSYLHANEIEQAELYWIKETQREFYSSEILALKKQQPIRHDSKIRCLVPILDSQDILRISTRLEEADFVIGEKQPILLPGKSKFTELLVMREHITDDKEKTLLAEIENIVNLRPLTYVSDDKDDPEPLTPAHCLYFGRNDFDYPMQFAKLFDKTISKETLRRRKLYQTVLLRQLWTRWKEQYLLQLRTAHKFKVPNVRENLKSGDDVLVEGTTKSKLFGSWEKFKKY